ncbi:MAG: PepSY-associated TM helix domain-containing protein [Bacteroidota bacterium]
MGLKKLIGKIHLWLGLTSGLFVFVIALTGSIYVFKDEIENATQDYRYVAYEDKEVLRPSEIVKIAEKALPSKEVHAVMYPEEGKTAKAIFYSDTDTYYYFVYINQYTGEVLKVSDENTGFFRFILNGHFYLWLPAHIGQPIVASATLIFLVMVLSGLFLWWPRAKNGRKQRFKIKWDARWRRKNYDLHNVLGFYVLTLALVFAITGLVWGFQWFSTLYYATISGGEKMEMYEEPLSKRSQEITSDLPAIDQIWLKMKDESPKGSAIEVHPPAKNNSSIAVNINPSPSTYWQTDYRYFNQYSLKELSVAHIWGRYKETSNAQKLMRMNYDIHVGSVLGLPGKILAFLASLVIASLPITGFLIWYGRKYKSKKQALIVN